MKSMTKINLTLESFTQHIIDELYRSCDKKTAYNIELNIENDIAVDALYRDGLTVNDATSILIDKYGDSQRVLQR